MLSQYKYGKPTQLTELQFRFLATSYFNMNRVKDHQIFKKYFNMKDMHTHTHTYKLLALGEKQKRYIK